MSLSASGQDDYNEWYLSKIVDNSNGLPENSVLSLYFDAHTGFLWLATEAGLVRYDGQEAFVFDKRQLPGMVIQRMLAFLPTLRQKMMVVDKGGRLYTIQGSLAEEYPADTLDNTTLFLGFSGNLPDVQLARNLSMQALGNGSFDLIKTPLPLLTIDSTNWISYSAHYLQLFNGKMRVAAWEKSSKEFPILMDNGGFVYALNDNGTGYRIDVGKRSCERLRCRDPAFTTGNPEIFFDKTNNQPFLLNGNRLYTIGLAGGRLSLSFVAVLDNLPNKVSSIVMHPGKKIIFVGSALNGLFVYSKNIFRTYTAKGNMEIIGRYSRDRSDVYSMVLPDSNHLLTSTSVLFNLARGSYSDLPFTIERPQTMLRDRQGHIWYGYADTLFNFNYGSVTNSKSFFLGTDGSTVLKNFLETLYQAPDGRIWVSTYAYLGYIDKDSIVRLISFPPQVSFCFSYLTQTPDGKFLGSNDLGVYLIDTVKRSYSRISEVETGNIRFLLPDSGGRCWITTYGNGLFLYDMIRKKCYPLPVDPKGYLLYSHCICEDGKNNFLVPTNKGLFRISKSNLLECAFQPEARLHYEYFDKSSGLQGNEFNGGCEPAFQKLSNGDILFPQLNGVVRVRVSELPESSSYPLYVSLIEAGKESIPITDKGLNDLRFGPNERVQTWHFSFAEWKMYANSQLSYRLDKDTFWTYLSSDTRQLRLTELSGGPHVLRVRLEAPLAPWNHESLAIPFHVDKLYYEQGWFWLLCLSLLYGLIHLLVKRRTIQLSRKNTALEAKVKAKTKELVDKNEQLNLALQELHEALANLETANLFKARLIGVLGHDIMIPLQYIAKVSAQLKHYHLKLSRETVLESLGEISVTASRLTLFSENILQWLKSQEGSFILTREKVTLYKIMHELAEFHRPILSEKGNSVENRIPVRLICWQDPNIIKIILHNLLINANKFTEGKAVVVEACLEEGELRIIVEDHGKGMPPELVESLNGMKPVASRVGTQNERGWGFGYLLIIDLLKLTGGGLYVESQPDRGTKVTITLADQAMT